MSDREIKEGIENPWHRSRSEETKEGDIQRLKDRYVDGTISLRELENKLDKMLEE